MLIGRKALKIVKMIDIGRFTISKAKSSVAVFIEEPCLVLSVLIIVCVPGMRIGCIVRNGACGTEGIGIYAILIVYPIDINTFRKQRNIGVGVLVTIG